VTPDSCDHKQAVEDLSVIRETNDRAKGSTYFADFFRSAGALFLLFGVLAMTAAALTHAVTTRMLVLPHPSGVIACAWALVFVIVGIAKMFVVAGRGRAAGMSVWGYGRSMLSPGFFHTLLPIALGAIAFVLYFARAGQCACVPAVLTLYVGAVYAAFGAIYLERATALAAYEMAILGALGLLFMTDRVGLYLGLVGAVFAVNGIVVMLTLGRRPLRASGGAATGEKADE
jgi:hypothetical protein